MKVGIICSANIAHMPYLEYYTNILDKNNIDYNIINWNKLNIEDKFEDKRITFNYESSLLKNKILKIKDYYKYSKFIKTALKENNYDKLIILTAQSGIFIKKYIFKHYKNKYILDIRDYASAKYYMSILENLIKNSYFTSISSPGYKTWLPKSDKYIISHNISNDRLKNLKNFKLDFKFPINVNTIGAIRHYNENIRIIDELKNNKDYNLYFMGKGSEEESLKLYCNKNSIDNVKFTGIYKREEEQNLYYSADIINIFTGNSQKRGELTNRLYNACVYGKPMIVSKSSYMKDIVEKYSLGFAIDIEKENLKEEIAKYIQNFDEKTFNEGRCKFIELVKNDQEIFESKLNQFIEIKEFL